MTVSKVINILFAPHITYISLKISSKIAMQFSRLIKVSSLSNATKLPINVIDSLLTLVCNKADKSSFDILTNCSLFNRLYLLSNSVNKEYNSLTSPFLLFTSSNIFCLGMSVKLCLLCVF